MIRTLIVEDSRVMQELLTHILSSDPEICVVGTAANGLEALEFIAKDKPDVVTMDLNMPKMDGYAATRKIMETKPVPIVVVSASLAPEEVEKAWRAIEAGAVAALEKPNYVEPGAAGSSAEKLIQTVKLMSQVKVVRRWARPDDAKRPALTVRRQAAAKTVAKVGIVGVGASTGGPPALRSIFSLLGPDFGAPIALVQHIAPGFSEGFVNWLNQSSSLEVHLAVHQEKVLPGHVYVAPDGMQMKVGRDLRVSLTTEDAENGLRPSVSYLFRYLAQDFGPASVGVLLTGMGRDGAKELRSMKDAGAVTIAQDKESSIVHGMPGEAILLGGATHVLAPDMIAEELRSLIGSPARQ
jgi:two-component system chemotaxis response regulator CheB